MRPTELQFRSPKEKTAEFGMPVVTKEGTILLPCVCEKKKHPTFAKDKRFSHYEDYAKLTGYRVGPGSYCTNNSAIGRARVRGTHVYKGFHGNKDVTNNGYIFVGNQMIFEQSLVLQNKKKDQKNPLMSTCAAGKVMTGTFQRVSTASTPSKHKRSESSKPRIMSPHIQTYSFH